MGWRLIAADNRACLEIIEFIIALLVCMSFKDLSSREDWSSGQWTNQSLPENLHATYFLFDAGLVLFLSSKLSVCSLVLSNQKHKLEIASWPDSRGHLCLDRWNPLSVLQSHCVDLKMHVLQHSREAKLFCKVRTFYFSRKTNRNNRSFPISHYWSREKPPQQACERPPEITWV